MLLAGDRLTTVDWLDHSATSPREWSRTKPCNIPELSY
jgi:hypothetical protein